MLVNRPAFNPLARAALVEIQSAGVDVTPEIVLWVHEAAQAIRKHPPRPVADLVDWPEMVGGVALYPLSFGAVAWLQGLPPRIRNSVPAIAFACAHSRDVERLAGLRGLLAAVAAITSWCLRLRCSHSALSAAVDRVINTDEVVEVKDAIKRIRNQESFHWGGMIRALCCKYAGTTPDYWTWRVSREYAEAMLHEASRELPEDKKVTDYEVEMNAQFRSIVDHIKANPNG